MFTNDVENLVVIMNTTASKEIRPVIHSGLADRLVQEQLISSTGAAEVAEQARSLGSTCRR